MLICTLLRALFPTLFTLHTSPSAQLASNLLSRDLSAEGLYPVDWALQTQRAAITLIAVLALHPDLKGDVVEVGRVWTAG